MWQMAPGPLLYLSPAGRALESFILRHKRGIRRPIAVCRDPLGTLDQHSPLKLILFCFLPYVSKVVFHLVFNCIGFSLATQIPNAVRRIVSLA